MGIENGMVKNSDLKNEILSSIIDIPFIEYSGCYLLYLADELVYVGVSTNIAVRLWQHRYKKEKDWDFIKWIEEKEYLKSLKIENFFINYFQPKYNVALSKNKALNNDIIINQYAKDEILSRINDLPFKQYIGCFLLYLDAELVYVGVSCEIAVRVKSLMFKIGKHWNILKYIETTDYPTAIKLEDYFIKTFKPKYNSFYGKYEHCKSIFGDKFHESKIPSPKGWGNK